MPIQFKETVTIPKEEYIKLLILKIKLRTLESWGVDNWDGYDEAMSLLHNSKEYQKLEEELDKED